MSDNVIEIPTSLGLLRASIAGATGEYPGIEVWLVKDSGEMGCVSLTEVTDFGEPSLEPVSLQTHSYDGTSEEPVTIECDPTGPWMFEVIEGRGPGRVVVLEEDGDRALLFDPASPDSPFLVVTGFDRISLSWSEASSYSDAAAAACAFKGYPDPEFSVQGFTPRDVIEAYPAYDISYEHARTICSDLNEGLSREGEDILCFADGEAEDIVASMCKRRSDVPSVLQSLEGDALDAGGLISTKDSVSMGFER